MIFFIVFEIYIIPESTNSCTIVIFYQIIVVPNRLRSLLQFHLSC